jgi:hypothetical protein
LFSSFVGSFTTSGVGITSGLISTSGAETASGSASGSTSGITSGLISTSGITSGLISTSGAETASGATSGSSERSSAASEATSTASSGAVGVSVVNSEGSAVEFRLGLLNSLASLFFGFEVDVSETLGLAVSVSGESDGLDGTGTFEVSSELIFSGGVAQVADEDAGGGLAFSGLSRSFFSGLGFFDSEGSATQFTTVLGDGLSDRFLVDESDEARSLGSSVSASEQVNIFDSTATFEEGLDFFFSSRERKALNEDFESGLLFLGLSGGGASSLGNLSLFLRLGLTLGLGHYEN